jgi:hypothetical protein
MDAPMITLYQGEPLQRSLVGWHKRVHCARGEGTPEPPTYWLTVTLPWRKTMYDITTDTLHRTFPKLSIGFRFRIGI